MFMSFIKYLDSIVLVRCIIAVWYLLLAGCGFTYSYTNVSDNQEYWGGYQNDTVLVLLKKVFLIELDNNRSNLALTPEGNYEHKNRYYTAPVSISDYYKNRNTEKTISGRAYHIKSKVIDVIPSGTKLKCCVLKLKKEWSWYYGSGYTLYLFAEVVDGKYKGTKVDILDMSTIKSLVNKKGLREYEPDLMLISIE